MNALRSGVSLVALILVCVPAEAQSAASRLDAVTQELEAVVADLEASQTQTDDLRRRLAELEALAAQHQDDSLAQDRLLAEYRTTVAELETHDRAATTLAQDLGGQLKAERKINAWLWPITGVAVAVAVAEGFFLLLR